MNWDMRLTDKFPELTYVGKDYTVADLKRDLNRWRIMGIVLCVMGWPVVLFPLAVMARAHIGI